MAAAVTLQSKREILDALHEKIRGCRKCELRAGCTQVVPGDGDAEAQIVIVGEAPGEDEDAQGIPFVGASGKHLRDIMQLNGMGEYKYYITNTARCRPPDNRVPNPSEIESCWPWTLEILKIIQPKILVPLGRPALMTLSLKYGFYKKVGQNPITKLAGVPIYLAERNVFVYPVFHPAYALRRSDAREAFNGHFGYLRKAIPGWLQRP